VLLVSLLNFSVMV